MKVFFKNALKVSFTSLIATIIVTILLLGLLRLAGFDSKILHMIGKVYIAIALPFLILNPVFGLIYAFYVKGKMKILFIFLHFASICTISVFAFIIFMFRYFVPFAP
ncbi:hypothetical protein QNH20_10860 [Neobacillus sp. WH10]|uniref:hypothetical protein n=1 Tax=Neobacillus sp. WH10 TaxID=3047873 RepID=UPI0024C128E6|nr:hypothetical protein [Neobacillus sp. WH10]WHY79601.1 hypothetical protein QNH20_10860 [Neobacillus sp. WH10]